MTSLRKKKISGKIYWYAIRNARVNGKPKTVWQRYLGTVDHVVDVFERFGKLDITLKTYDFGGIAALLAVAEELQRMRVRLVKVKGTKKAKIVVEQMTLEQANLFSALKLNRVVPDN
ncbi:hypothetical protein IPdc08_01239 [archaeon]|nr:hypothetical protein IPdc08_01239 [archaeon]